MSKVELPTVTIIAYDNTEDPTRTLQAMHHCQEFFKFAGSILVCGVAPHGLTENDRIHLVQESGYAAAQQFEAVEIGNFVETDHAFYVSHDGYIRNPDAWNPLWLTYDFIGSPWPPDIVNHPKYRVGNNGFCLQSRKFMDACSESAFLYSNTIPSDVFICQHMRPLFEQTRQMRYAPIEVAADFGWELNIPEFPNGRPDAFGFHGGHEKKISPLKRA